MAQVHTVIVQRLIKVINNDAKRSSWPASMHDHHGDAPAHVHAGLSRAVGTGAWLTTATATPGSMTLWAGSKGHGEKVCPWVRAVHGGAGTTGTEELLVPRGHAQAAWSGSALRLG